MYNRLLINYHNHNQKYDSLLVIYYTITGPPPKEWCQILATPEGMVPNSGPPPEGMVQLILAPPRWNGAKF